MNESAASNPVVLQESEWNTLGRLAREAIEAWVRGIASPSVQDVPEPLRQRAGVFVTLYRNGRLRGCVGTLNSADPLSEAVPRLAVAAAFDDYRFPPLREDELQELTIEISILSPMREIASPADIEIGTHGVVLSLDGARAVFLPKVAKEQGWDRSELLEHLCLKAGLPREAWSSPRAKLFVFRTATHSFAPEQQ